MCYVKKNCSNANLFCGIVSYSQNTGMVKGKIIDSKTRESIPFVNVIIDGTSAGSISNEAGIFEINNVNINLNPIPTTSFPTPAKRPAFSVLDKTKIKKVFQVEIKDWKESLRTCKI